MFSTELYPGQTKAIFLDVILPPTATAALLIFCAPTSTNIYRIRARRRIRPIRPYTNMVIVFTTERRI